MGCGSQDLEKIECIGCYYIYTPFSLFSPSEQIESFLALVRSFHYV